MKSPWKNFTIEELSCHGKDCCGGEWEMVDEFMRQMAEVRKMCGFALPVTSGYRCPAYNAKVSKTGGKGPHTTGRAMDIAIYGDSVAILLDSLLICHVIIPEIQGGLGLKQHGPWPGRYVHVDNMTTAQAKSKRPWIWTYP